MVWMTRLWPSLLALARVVQPATILRWHRAGFGNKVARQMGFAERPILRSGPALGECCFVDLNVQQDSPLAKRVIGLLVHQGFDLKALSDLHLEQPSFSHQIGIQQAGIGEHLLIDFDDLTCDWSVDIRCRINRLYDSGRFAGLDRGAYCSYSRRQQDKGHEEHAAEGGPDPGFHSRVHAVFPTAERRGGCCISFRGHRALPYHSS